MEGVCEVTKGPKSENGSVSFSLSLARIEPPTSERNEGKQEESRGGSVLTWSFSRSFPEPTDGGLTSEEEGSIRGGGD